MAMDPPPSQPTASGSGTLRIPESAANSSFDASTTTPAHPPDAGVVDSPVSPASPNALARFEFEAGRGNEGSKILMVEWDPTPSGEDGWAVTWEGKKTTFPVYEKVEDSDSDPDTETETKTETAETSTRQRRQRVYFLLPSAVPIPPNIAITHAASGRALAAKSMPAIFAPGLGVGEREAGRRGVLHAAWARLRAAQLQDEIRAELRDNSEGVGLEMAVQERLWIIDHFGLDDLRLPDSAGAGDGAAVPAASQLPPASPRSPVAGKLGEKLRGLKLATSPADLASSAGNIGSYNPHLPGPDRRPPPNVRGEEVTPPRTGADPAAGGVASLDAVLGGGSAQVAAAPPMAQSKETEDELFALPMSPRSPDMKTKSPFGLLR